MAYSTTLKQAKVYLSYLGIFYSHYFLENKPKVKLPAQNKLDKILGTD